MAVLRPAPQCHATNGHAMGVKRRWQGAKRRYLHVWNLAPFAL